MAPVKKPQLLVDTDALIWRYSTMRKDPLVFPNEKPLDGLELAKLAFKDKLQYLREDTGISDIVLCLPREGRGNFRYRLFPQYKSNRKAPVPPTVTSMYEWVRDYYRGILWSPDEPWETDDIIAEAQRVAPSKRVVVGIDKDFYQLPGWNLHPFTGELRRITPQSAEVFKAYQVLRGDTADNIPGCPRIGDVKARQIITGYLSVPPAERVGTIWQLVLMAYRVSGLSVADYNLNYRLVHLGSPDYGLPTWLPEEYERVLEVLNETP